MKPLVNLTEFKMHLNIQGRHLKITPALNDYVKDKIKKVKAHFDHIIHAHVVLEVIKTDQSAEATITVDHHHFHNKIVSENMYKSIDILFDKIERQVRRYKEHRISDDRRKSRETLLEELIKAKEASQVELEEVAISEKPLNDLEAISQIKAGIAKKFIAYYAKENASTFNFLIEKETSNNFELFAFDANWEKKEVSIEEETLKIHHVINEKLSTEAIEDAVEYLNHNDKSYRFFRSVRTDKPVFLIKNKENHFSVVREVK